MLITLLSVVVALLVAGVLVWAIDALPAIDPTFKQVAKVVIIVVVIIYIIFILFGLVGGVGRLPAWR